MIEKLTPAVLALTLVAGCGTAAVLPTADASTSPLRWGACPGGGGADGMDCASLRVPLDWSAPDGRQVTLMLGRLRADGGTPSAGTVLVNYGGPGGPGVELMRDRTISPGSQPFAQLRHSMDVVTWDPRGYGGLSTPAIDWSCLSTVSGRGEPDLPRDPAQFDQLAATSLAEATACRQQDPELFDHMDAASNARDMEAIRTALGVPALNLYMGSYGSVYGETYASLFPRQVRTMVIDGGGDHTVPFDQSQDAIARDNQVRMARFTAWCAGDPSCALHGRDIPRLWQQLVARADRTPVPAPAVHARFDGWTMQEVATGLLIRAGQAAWTALAQDIKAADAGDATGFAASPQHPYPAMSYPVSECREWPRFTSYAQLTSTVARLDRIDPNLGAAGTIVPYSLACVGWPAGVDNPPQPLPVPLAPLLGVGTWDDFPATQRVVRRVPGSGTVYHDGTGHELYATGNTCVISYVDAYFTDRRLPPVGARC